MTAPFLENDSQEQRVLSLWRKIHRTGWVAEPSPSLPGGAMLGAAAAPGGSVLVRHVDAGSCNGCEVEIGSAFGPVYDAERYGARAWSPHRDTRMRYW